jgi:hypothetical protein
VAEPAQNSSFFERLFAADVALSFPNLLEEVQMRVPWPWLMVASLIAGSVGCATGGGVEANSSRFERDVGVATALDAYEKSMKVIRQYQFDIERETREGRMYIETRWRGRTPFADEQALGIAAAQNRVIVRTAPRSSTGQGELFSVNLVVENRVNVQGSPDWTEAVATSEYRAYAQKITEDLKRELDVGVRRFGGSP